MARFVDGKWYDDFMNEVYMDLPVSKPDIKEKPAVVEPVSELTAPAAVAPVSPGPAAEVKSEIYDLYAYGVYSAWRAYSDERAIIMQSFNNAIILGQAELEDKSRVWVNTAELKAAQKRENVCKELYKRYLATNDGQSELKAIIINAIMASPREWIAQTDNGRYCHPAIHERNQHAVYESLNNFFNKVAPGLYHFKSYSGYTLLISDFDPLQSQIFTVHPLDAMKI